MYKSHQLLKSGKFGAALKIAAAIGVLFPSMHANAVVEQAFSLPMTVEYDTNPVFLSNDKESAWRYLIVPTYGIKLDDGLNTWFADGSLAVERSSNTDLIVKREDPTVNFGWIRQIAGGKVRVRGGYEENSARIVELQRAGLILGTDQKRRTRMFEVNFEKLLTEKLTAFSDFTYEKTTFSGGDIGVVGYYIPTLRVAAEYQLTERTIPLVEFQVSELNPESSPESRFTGAMAGSKFLISPAFEWNFRAGWYDVNGSGNAESFNDWQGVVAAIYRTNKTSTKLEASRLVEPSGIGEYYKVDRFQGQLNYELTSLSDVGANVDITKNEFRDFDFKFRQASVFYRRTVAQNWDALFNVAHRQLLIEGDRIYSNTVGFTVTYKIPTF